MPTIEELEAKAKFMRDRRAPQRITKDDPTDTPASRAARTKRFNEYRERRDKMEKRIKREAGL